MDQQEQSSRGRNYFGDSTKIIKVEPNKSPIIKEMLRNDEHLNSVVISTDG